MDSLILLVEIVGLYENFALWTDCGIIFSSDETFCLYIVHPLLFGGLFSEVSLIFVGSLFHAWNRFDIRVILGSKVIFYWRAWLFNTNIWVKFLLEVDCLCGLSRIQIQSWFLSDTTNTVKYKGNFSRRISLICNISTWVVFGTIFYLLLSGWNKFRHDIGFWSLCRIKIVWILYMNWRRGFLLRVNHVFMGKVFFSVSILAVFLFVQRTILW